MDHTSLNAAAPGKGYVTFSRTAARVVPKMAAMPRTVAEVESFITMLRAACSDEAVNATLEKALSLPDARRQAMLHTWITDVLTGGGPPELAQALACLMDDAVAEKAYEAIFECRR